jgi:hypothetical protein
MALVAGLAMLATAALPASAAKRSKPPRVISVRCWPVAVCGQDPHVVTPGGRLRFRGRHLKKGMLVLFRGRAHSSGGANRSSALMSKLRLRRPDGLVTTVPFSARSGRIRVVTKDGARSNVVGPIKIRRQVQQAPRGSGTAFDGTGMWIWYVSRSNGGNLASIAAQAHQYGVRTVFVKSSDGSSWWDQFSPPMISALKAAGLHVCAWQFVYGDHASAEASLGARAAQTGADCLVIDAEGQYEGKYAQAQTYVQNLRSLIGEAYPVGLASFPYVDYHPSLPYSVFLGPGGAQYNVPQMYWKAIGTSVDNVYAHTFLWNAVYGRRIFPLGQLYDGPSASDVRRFRQLAVSYGSSGTSWWSWQSASQTGWNAIAPPDPTPVAITPPGYPQLRSGSKGDVVVWAQEHLMSAGQQVTVNGSYDSRTQQAVGAFQAGRGLPLTGVVDNPTWTALLSYPPAPVSWTGSGATRASAASSSRRTGPRSAHVRARRYEIPRSFGAR